MTFSTYQMETKNVQGNTFNFTFYSAVYRSPTVASVFYRYSLSFGNTKHYVFVKIKYILRKTQYKRTRVELIFINTSYTRLNHSINIKKKNHKFIERYYIIKQ